MKTKSPHPKLKVLKDPLAQRYSKLKRCLTQRNTKVVVSLGGGGIRLFAHCSVLRFLENLGVADKITEIWGASGGAMVGLLYSRGCSPGTIEDLGLKAVMEQQFPLVPSYLSVVKKLLWEKLLSSLRYEPTTKGFHDCQERLQELTAEILKGRKEKIPFYCLAYNVKTDQTDVLTPTQFPEKNYQGWIYHEDPLDAVIASCSVPVLFVPKVIKHKNGKRTYADGAIVEDVPSTSIYKKWLRDKEMGVEKRKHLLVIAVNLNPYFRSIGLLNNWLFRQLPGFDYLLLSAHYGDVMRQARTMAQKRILTSDPNVDLWDLSLDMPPGGLMNINLIPKVIETAKRSIPKQFSKINESLLT